MELLRKIEDEGETKLHQIHENAQQEAERLKAEAERELAAWRDEKLREARAQIESEKRLIVSRSKARAREAVLKSKGNAAEQLFDRLESEAAGFREDKRVYKAFLSRCLKEAEGQIKGKLLLEIDPKDEEIVKEVIKGTDHEIGGKIRSLGGFIATNKNGDLLVDNRLETRISNLRQQHRSDLSGALFK